MTSTYWAQHDGNTMPTVNSDNTLTFNGGVNEYIADSYLLDPTQDFEITVEFDNNTTSSGTHDFAMFLIGEPMGSNPPLMILRQQGYSAWGANNSFFFGLYDGSSSYTSSGAGPAQLASGAMRIKKTGSLYEFFSSSDKVAFTKMGEINAAGQPFDSVDPLKVVIKTGSRTTEVSGYSNSQQPALTDGLIAKYALDTNADDSVSSNDLSASGAVSYGVDGNHTAALFSSGELMSANTIDLTGQATVSFWAKAGTPIAYSGNNYESFFRWGTHAGSHFDLYLLNGKIRALHNAGNGWVDNRGTVAVPAGWNHYAITIDPSSGSKIVYLNGVAQTLTGAAFSGTFASAQQIWLGNISTDSAFRSNGGKMDDTRIWTRVLSASEIAGLHASGAETYTPTPETTLVGHWSFDNGNAVADVGTDGAATGASFVTDAGRTAASFDGNDQISIPHGADNAFGTGDFTVSMWFNPDVASYGPTGQGTLWSKDYTNLEIFLWGGQIKAYMGGAGNRMNGGNVSTGSWQHLVLTRTGTDVKMYINGADVGSVEAGSPGTANLSAGSNDVLLGVRAGNGSSYYQGKMDDVRHYSMGFDASQVDALYNSTTVAPTPETTLEGHWSFDSDGSPTVGSDTFTLANGTTFASDSGRDAAYFPNTNSMMYASPKISLGSEYTISVWFKDLKDNSSSSGGWLNLDGHSLGANGEPSSPSKHNLSVNPSSYLGAFDGSNFLSSGHQMTQVLYNGTGWHHLVATYDGTSIRYYINGSQVGNAVTFGGTDGIQIINGWSNYARTFASYLDDLRVYSMAFDASEVATLHTETTVSPPATPIQKNGYYPLYLAESDANGHDGGNGSSHFHEFDGVTYYMPNGLTMDVDQFHGTYGLVLEHDMEDTSADVGSIDFSQAGTGTISFVSDVGRDAVKMDDNLHGSLHLASNLDLGSGGWTLSAWFKNIRHAENHSNWSQLFSHWTGSMANGSWPQIISIDGNGELFNRDASNTHRSTGYDIVSNVADSNWHRITAVYDGSSEISYYIDGSYVGGTSGWDGHSLVSEINGSPDNDWFNSNVDSGGYKRTFAEYVSDVRAWSRSMDADEVAYWYAETTVAPILHGLNMRRFLPSRAIDSSSTNAYIHRQAGKTMLSLTPDASNSPNVHVDLGTEKMSSVTEVSDGIMAIALETSVKFVRIEAGSGAASVVSTVSDNLNSGIRLVSKDRNFNDPGEKLVLFNENGEAFEVTTSTDGLTQGSVTQISIDIPADSGYGADSHIIDSEVAGGFFVVVVRKDDSSSHPPKLVVYQEGVMESLALNNLPIANIWEINYVFLPSEGAMGWIISDGVTVASTTNLLSWV